MSRRTAPLRAARAREPVTWALVRLDGGARRAMGLPDVAWPVPADEVDDVMRPPVALDRLVEAADRWCAGHPDRAGALAPAVARLAYAVSVDELDDHNYEAAEHHLRLGLHHDPGNVSLRSHLGLALWGAGRRAEATVELGAAVETCRATGRLAPLLWLLCARALDERGHFAEALPLLEELAGLLPAEEAFWELLARVRQRAAAASAAGAAGAPPSVPA